MYALDFGRGGLKSITALPHLGACIDASEAARVDQLLRMLRNFITERQEQLEQIAVWFAQRIQRQHAGECLSGHRVIVIDNFAEFRESYEHLIPELMALIRDGRQFGVHFVITANAINEIGGKLFGMFANRLTLAQSDTGAYADIVGSGARPFDNVAGRGLIAVTIKEGDKPVPLEFQVGLPGVYETPAARTPSRRSAWRSTRRTPSV